MSEQAPQQQEHYHATKYTTPRNEVLGEMAVDGWANASSGDVESATGHFSRITNTEAELDEITAAFSEIIAEMSRFGFVREDLIGNFLVVTDNEGFVDVRDFASPKELEEAFELLDTIYSQWLGGDDE